MTSLLSRLVNLPRSIRQALGTDHSAYRYAIAAVPHILAATGPVRSVVDLGCGRGQWLAAFKDNGITDVHGYDCKRFRQGYLEHGEYTRLDLSKPRLFYPKGQDLAISLEVAEHLTPQAGRMLVMNLCNLAPKVLFSAATPGQGGLGHVNEQPRAYWDALFQERKFRLADTFENVPPGDCPWYTANMCLYVEDKQ